MRSVFFPGNKVAKNLVLNPSSGTRQFFFEKSANPTTLLLYQFFEHEKRKFFFIWQIPRSFMPIRAVEISEKFLIFLFSPLYLDSPPPKPRRLAPQSFFPPF